MPSRGRFRSCDIMHHEIFLFLALKSIVAVSFIEDDGLIPQLSI